MLSVHFVTTKRQWWLNRIAWGITWLMIGYAACHLTFAFREVGPTKAQAKENLEQYRQRVYVEALNETNRP